MNARGRVVLAAGTAALAGAALCWAGVAGRGGTLAVVTGVCLVVWAFGAVLVPWDQLWGWVRAVSGEAVGRVMLALGGVGAGAALMAVGVWWLAVIGEVWAILAFLSLFWKGAR